jgi:hypothetical protein
MGLLLRRYWGVLALLAALACWVGVVLGKVTTAIVGLVLVLSVGALVYFLFQAPLWCGAVTREGTLCRNKLVRAPDRLPLAGTQVPETKDGVRS